MEFFSNQIQLGNNKSLSDVVANQAEPDTRSLDEIIAGIKTANTQEKVVKTASKVEASEEAEIVEAASDDEEVVEVTDSSEADAEGDDADAEAAAEEEVVEASAEPEVLELDAAAQAAYFGEAEAEGEKATPLAAKKPTTLKVAKKADFRSWNAEDVVKAWNNYESIEKCASSVSELVSDPKVYCGLLQVASDEANKLLKEAGSCDCKDCSDDCDCGCHNEVEETCATASNKKKSFQVLAKLKSKDLGMLRKYWTDLYGEEYVTAMLGEYAD